MNPNNPLRTARVMEFFISPTQVTFKFDASTNPNFFADAEVFCAAVDEYIEAYSNATHYDCQLKNNVVILIVYGRINMNAATQFM